MIKLDDSLLAELGLQALPAEEKQKLLRHIYETLEKRVGTTLAMQMTEQQLKEFEQFIEREDEAGALHWLETNFPNYRDVVAHEFETIKNEVRQAAPQILASASQPAMPPQAYGSSPSTAPAYGNQPSDPMYQQPYSQQQSAAYPPQYPTNMPQGVPQPQYQPVAQPQAFGSYPQQDSFGSQQHQQQSQVAASPSVQQPQPSYAPMPDQPVPGQQPAYTNGGFAQPQQPYYPPQSSMQQPYPPQPGQTQSDFDPSSLGDPSLS